MKNPDRFGINVIKYAAEHEAYINEQLKSGADKEALFNYHNTKLKWLQHERLIHLIVTFMTATVFIILLGVSMFVFNLGLYLLLAVVGVLLVAYLYHYFRLENKVQQWYKLADRIYFTNKEN